MSEIGLIAATRGIAGAGAGLLLAAAVPEKNRKAIGWGLVAFGALTALPLIVDIFRKSAKPTTTPHAPKPHSLNGHHNTSAANRPRRPVRPIAM